jgi:ribosomal protein L11 methyltransferase
LKYPALDVSHADGELLLAAIDECAPTAVETHETSLTIFFANIASRDCARRAIEHAFPAAVTQAREVDDGDWARRSQENLTPITVGRITVTPPWFSNLQPPTSNLLSSIGPGSVEPPVLSPEPLVIVIAPSMGFGTGHHATTRLCLEGLQRFNHSGGVALDVGTGSGLLAIAARLLGAREAVGIDNDADAIDSARENLATNPNADHVRFDVADLRSTTLPRADIVTANLTGALLIRSAPMLLSALSPNGTLIVSGLLTSERGDVEGAFALGRLVWEAEEDGWQALGFRLQAPGSRLQAPGSEPEPTSALE